MAITNYTLQPRQTIAPIQLAELKQRPGIGELQNLLNGKDDQIVMILRVLIALAENETPEGTAESDYAQKQINLYRRNLNELAMLAKSVLSPATAGPQP